MIPVKVSPRTNPVNKEVKYYMVVNNVRPITLDRVVTRISDRCTLTKPDIIAVLNALQTEVINALQDGQSVRLGDLGSFRPTVSSEGVSEEKKADTSLIKAVRARFTPGSYLRAALQLTNTDVKFSTDSDAAKG